MRERASSSTFPASQIGEAQWVAQRRGRERFVCEQPPYSILVRGIEADVLPTCQRYGMGVIPWSPLAGGWLTVALLIVIALVGTMPVTVLFVWLAVFGFCAAFTPLVIAHGKSLFPPHLIGRGIATVGNAVVFGLGSDYDPRSSGIEVLTPHGAPPVVPTTSS